MKERGTVAGANPVGLQTGAKIPCVLAFEKPGDTGVHWSFDPETSGLRR